MIVSYTPGYSTGVQIATVESFIVQALVLDSIIKVSIFRGKNLNFNWKFQWRKTICPSFQIFISICWFNNIWNIAFVLEYLWVWIWVLPGNSYWRGRLSTVDLLIKRSYFIKKEKIVSVWKAADLNWLAQGGQQYWNFPFSRASMVEL